MMMNEWMDDGWMMMDGWLDDDGWMMDDDDD